MLFSWPVLFLAVSLTAVALWGVFRNIFRYTEIKKEVAAAEEKLSEYEESKKRFEERLKALDTPEGLEKEARARFNLKKPGEEVAIFLDSGAPRKDLGFRENLASAWESIKLFFSNLVGFSK